MAAATKEAVRGGVYKLLIGIHFGDGPEGCECKGCAAGNRANHAFEAYDTYARRCKQEGTVPVSEAKYTGDLIESAVDLEKRFNSFGSKKFERVS